MRKSKTVSISRISAHELATFLNEKLKGFSFWKIRALAASRMFDFQSIETGGTRIRLAILTNCPWRLMSSGIEIASWFEAEEQEYDETWPEGEWPPHPKLADWLKLQELKAADAREFDHAELDSAGNLHLAFGNGQVLDLLPDSQSDNDDCWTIMISHEDAKNTSLHFDWTPQGIERALLEDA